MNLREVIGHILRQHVREYRLEHDKIEAVIRERETVFRCPISTFLIVHFVLDIDLPESKIGSAWCNVLRATLDAGLCYF
jgi:hypothetical protein